MKTSLVFLAAMFLTACASMTPRQKNAVAIVGTALVVGAVAAHGGKRVPDLSEMTPARPKACPYPAPKSREIYIC
jgi:hypothetical protein